MLSKKTEINYEYQTYTINIFLLDTGKLRKRKTRI